MAVLSATETLKILATGKATLKQLVELEEKAELEALTPPQPAPTPDPAPTGGPEPAPTGGPEPAPTGGPEPDEKDLKITELENKLAELEDKLKEAQQDNINANNGGVEPTFEEQLDEMFRGYRY